MTSSLPTATAWFRVERLTPTITRIDEPHVHELLRANIWHVRGTARDLVVDAGLGVASLRDQLPELFAHDPVLVLTHAHLDHVGSAHEFTDRRMHSTSRVDSRMPATLHGPELARQLGLDRAGLPELLIDHAPAGFDPERYSVPAAPPTHQLVDGDVIDLGDRQLRVLHLPGHTPGSLCLLDPRHGDLFSGDVIYDDVLLDELYESDVTAYVRSLQRLRELPIRTVFPGHEATFDGARMREIIDDYLRGRGRTTQL